MRATEKDTFLASEKMLENEMLRYGKERRWWRKRHLPIDLLYDNDTEMALVNTGRIELVV